MQMIYTLILLPANHAKENRIDGFPSIPTYAIEMRLLKLSK